MNPIPFEKLPQDIKEIITSFGSAFIIQKIQERFSLNDKQGSDMAKLAGQVLIGELNLQDFIPALEEDLKIDSETARNLGQEIHRQIFLPVRDSLRKVQEQAQSSQQGEVEPPSEVQPLQSGEVGLPREVGLPTPPEDLPTTEEPEKKPIPPMSPPIPNNYREPVPEEEYDPIPKKSEKPLETEKEPIIEGNVVDLRHTEDH